MNHIRNVGRLAFAVVMVLAQWTSHAQAQPRSQTQAQAQAPSDTIDFSGRETEMVKFLTEQGARVTAGRVVVYLPRGGLPSADAQTLAERLNRGLEALEAFTHTPHSWQRKPAALEYYFHPSMFVSYANDELNRVFIAFPRLQAGGAPVLHEAVHVILYPTPAFFAAKPASPDEDAEEPGWLHEGLATYVGKRVSADTGLPEGDPVNTGSLAELDPRCAAVLASPVGAEIAPFIGGLGGPAALSSRERRNQVAPGFYGCAASFTKFLVGRFGIDAVIDLLPAADSLAALEKLTGKTVDAVRADWRKEIGADR